MDIFAACGVNDTSVENNWNILKNVPPLGQFIFFSQAQRAGRRGAEHANATIRPAGTVANAYSFSEMLMYDIATHSATPIHSNITKILRMDRQQTSARRISADHDPAGSIAVPFSRARRRPQRRELLSAGKDLRLAWPGFSRISARTITARRDEAHGVFTLSCSYAQWLLSGAADHRAAANSRQRRLQSN